MRLPNLQKARCCRQNCAIHRELGGQEPATKKQIEYFLFEKMCLPNLQKATVDVADKIGKIMAIWVRSRGRKNNLNIFYLKKCACPTFEQG